MSIFWRDTGGSRPDRPATTEGTSYVHRAHFPAADQRPTIGFPFPHNENPPVAVWQADLRDRIRGLADRLTERERALMGLVWLEVELCDQLPGNTVRWTLHCLDTLVRAIEAAEAPAGTEPP
jgi:hypothetical protein